VKESNVKAVSQLLAMVSLLAPITAQPLGIGDIELHSALNQKLEAQIKLHVASGENPADVSVRLAPPEKFDQAGIPWSYFLSKIKFQPVVQANGDIVVKVSSREPITEPFLNFLLEISWPQGSQYREYTVLMDPPAEYQPSAIPSATSPEYSIEPLEEPSAPKATPRRSRNPVRTASNISPQTPTDGEYGPTQSADTLWHIAEQLAQQREVPTKQMLTALYRANPDAFNHGNINSLKTGVVLKIPETAAIMQSGQKAGTKTAAPVKPQTSDVKPSKPLELVAPSDAKIAENAEVGGQVKSGGTSTGGNISGDSGTGEADTGQADLQARIDRLEQQINMMQQLLALKDQQLATLQNQGSAEPGQPAPTPEQEAKTQPEPPPIPAPVAQQEVPIPAPAPIEPAQQTTPAPQPPAAEPAPKPEPQARKPVPPPAPEVVAEEEGFFSSSVYYLTAGGLGLGILGGLGWLYWRKRKPEGQPDTESMFASATQIRMPDADSALSVPVLDMTSSGNYDVGTVGESSFISDFTPSDFEAFDTDQAEVDPLSEADVYLAYGRYQQAEDLIKEAIKEHPQKDEFKLKLLEIFYANENREAFGNYAQELANAGKQADKGFWNKVTDMASEIVPDSPLFGGTSTVSAAPPPKETKASFEPKSELATLGTDAATELNLDDDLSELRLDEDATLDDNGLDFDLSSFSIGDDEAAEDKQNSADTDIESIEFNFDGLATVAEHQPTDEKSPVEEFETFDFNFDLDDSQSKSAEQRPAPQPEQTASATEIEELDGWDFPEFVSPADDKSAAPLTLDSSGSKQPEKIPGSDADEFDFNFDFDAPALGTEEESDFGLGVSDLTDMDELETKIDLAKAYIDMGDTEAARKIASEVLEKGSKEQKQAAQALLDELT